jgi:hypothetical protein
MSCEYIYYFIRNDRCAIGDDVDGLLLEGFGTDFTFDWLFVLFTHFVSC